MKRATRLMVVEDEGVTALDLERTLTRMGFEVLAVCSTGEAAVERARALAPDLVLMDVRLAGELDGIDAADQIRQRADIPVVYLTAHGDKATLARARVTEPYAYVLKPFDERELQIAVEVALFRHATAAKLKGHATELETLVAARTRDLEQRTRELEQRTRELELATRVKSDFLGAVSHELKTPLNHIVGFSQLLLDAPPDQSAESRAEQLRSILEGGQRLTRLVNDLLTLAKLDFDALEVKLAPAAIAELLRATAAVFAEHAAAKGVTLTVDVAPVEARVVLVDAPKLGHAVAHLLCNAIKFTSAGGHAWLRAVPGTRPGEIEVTVEDTGVGIADEALPRVFTAFEKTGVGRGAPEGLGVGLALAHGLLAAQGAELRVAKQPTGTQLAFTLREAAEA
ncbi:MAG: response regulator [Myxococcales bacterium]|nr:response regulator [Myxococcales bacterium]